MLGSLAARTSSNSAAATSARARNVAIARAASTTTRPSRDLGPRHNRRAGPETGAATAMLPEGSYGRHAADACRTMRAGPNSVPTERPQLRGQRGRPALRAIDAHSTVRGAPTAGTERAQRPPCRPLRKAASRSRCFVSPAEQFSRDRHSLPSATDRALPLHALPSKGVADIRSHGRNSTFKSRRRGFAGVGDPIVCGRADGLRVGGRPTPALSGRSRCGEAATVSG